MSFGPPTAYDEPAAFGTRADPFAIDAAKADRAAFIRKTYGHLLMAVLIFCGIEGLFLSYEPLQRGLMQLIGGNWWIALIAFMGVSYVAQKWAHSDSSSPTKQYLGLGLYIVAEALIFVPLMTWASFVGEHVIPTVGLGTAIIFGGLTAVVMISGADFSFLRGALTIGMFAAIGLVICSFLFGLNLGLFFTVGMIVLMSGYILYDTSNVLHHYRTHQHVAASLSLFASVATLFFYVVRLVGIFGGDE